MPDGGMQVQSFLAAGEYMWVLVPRTAADGPAGVMMHWGERGVPGSSVTVEVWDTDRTELLGTETAAGGMINVPCREPTGGFYEVKVTYNELPDEVAPPTDDDLLTFIYSQHGPMVGNICASCSCLECCPEHPHRVVWPCTTAAAIQRSRPDIALAVNHEQFLEVPNV